MEESTKKFIYKYESKLGLMMLMCRGELKLIIVKIITKIFE